MMSARPAPPPSSDDAALARRRRGRNIALFAALLALALLFYAIAMVKMAQLGLGG